MAQYTAGTGSGPTLEALSKERGHAYYETYAKLLAETYPRAPTASRCFPSVACSSWRAAMIWRRLLLVVWR